jgi:hypothetical protein
VARAVSQAAAGGIKIAKIIASFADDLMLLDDLIALAVVLAYRLAGYAVLNLLDDAAIMAMMFC